MSWNDTLDERNSWGMSTGLQSDRPDNGAQVSGNYQHLSSAGEWDISGTYAANDYSSVSSSWSGSFTATQYGAAFHRRSSTNEPRLMVSTDGVARYSGSGQSRLHQPFWHCGGAVDFQLPAFHRGGEHE